MLSQAIITFHAASAMMTESARYSRLQSRTSVMIPVYDIEYSLKRELVHRASCAAASDKSVQAAHLVLADRYADRAWGAREARCEDLKC